MFFISHLPDLRRDTAYRPYLPLAALMIALLIFACGAGDDDASGAGGGGGSIGGDAALPADAATGGDAAAGDAATDDDAATGGDAAVAEGGSTGDAGSIPEDSWILVDYVTNARDIGGLPLANGKRVVYGKVFRGGSVDRLSNDGCAEFASLEIKTVVDLRRPVVATDRPAPDCVSDRASVVEAPMPKMDPTPDYYRLLVDESEVTAKVFAALGDEEGYPVYIHCVIGRDRASVVTALVLLALGADEPTVVDEFMVSNQAGVTVQSEWIEAAIDEIDERGGIEDYLESVGVTAKQVETLREIAIAE
jgi:hypothetical protein